MSAAASLALGHHGGEEALEAAGALREVAGVPRHAIVVAADDTDHVGERLLANGVCECGHCYAVHGACRFANCV